MIGGAGDWPVSLQLPLQEQASLVRDLSRQVLDQLGRSTGRPNAPVSIHWPFALLYHCSIERNLEVAARSRQPSIQYRVIVEFYRLYFESVVRRVWGDVAYRPTPQWDAYFRLADALDRGRLWIALPMLLRAGARAHAGGDLSEVMASVLGAIDDHAVIEAVGHDLFGPASDHLYATVMDDFTRAICDAPALQPRPVAFALMRLSNRALGAPIVRGLQAWRRAALDRALNTLAEMPPTFCPVPAE